MSEEQMAKLQQQVDAITAQQQKETRHRKLAVNGAVVAFGLFAIGWGVYTLVKNK